MKKHSFLLLPVGIVLIVAVGLNAKDLDTKGKAWLGPHTEAAAINVNGSWHAKEWGTIVLTQAQGRRRRWRWLGYHWRRQRQASLLALLPQGQSQLFR